MNVLVIMSVKKTVVLLHVFYIPCIFHIKSHFKKKSQSLPWFFISSSWSEAKLRKIFTCPNPVLLVPGKLVSVKTVISPGGGGKKIIINRLTLAFLHEYSVQKNYLPAACKNRQVLLVNYVRPPWRKNCLCFHIVLRYLTTK